MAEPDLIFEIPVLFKTEPDWLKIIPVPVERTGIVFCKIRFPFLITSFRSYPNHWARLNVLFSYTIATEALTPHIKTIDIQLFVIIHIVHNKWERFHQNSKN
jgi:hypothetical protein